VTKAVWPGWIVMVRFSGGTSLVPRRRLVAAAWPGPLGWPSGRTISVFGGMGWFGKRARSLYDAWVVFDMATSRFTVTGVVPGLWNAAEIASGWLPCRFWCDQNRVWFCGAPLGPELSDIGCTDWLPSIVDMKVPPRRPGEIESSLWKVLGCTVSGKLLPTS
jgi:hypothetical protein